LREWLSYIASDQLQGRAVFSTGIGLAASYIQGHLMAWGVKPGGDHGSYLQTVRILGVKRASRSTVTVEVGGETRTFADGDAIRFASNAGAKQRLVLDRVEFAGYGLDVPAARREDYRGKDVSGAAVVWLGSSGPDGLDPAAYRLLLTGRHRYAVEQMRAAASIGVVPPGSAYDAQEADEPGGAGRVARPAESGARGRGRGPLPVPDFTTSERLDRAIAPTVTATDSFFQFLFARAPVKYEELKRRADAREPLPSFRLDGVRITFNVDTDYEVVRTQLAYNIVGIVEGSDPELRNAFVAFGAHYDHVGYAEGELVSGSNPPRRTAAPGRITRGAEEDRIWNGADDDGSGTVTLMALARAFATGPAPKRSLIFVWHTGEERGRWGSLYFADHPAAALDRFVAQLNIDMVGRNREDKASESNTLYLVGSDRISSELDAVSRAANNSLPRPLRLDFELNDPSDPEQLYHRSDHYSYASRGVPVIFFTTGLHSDYHANTDEVSRIDFDKMTRIAQYVYEVGARVANLDHALARDNKGPRAGKGAR
jgi:hypothetical protein